ncbi:cupin [Rhodococcus pyridinivorans]|uniref:cupin n=1 Tax=Rhodococcus pyridinivorans TaxID=103816 RepID=UPI0039B61080
MSTQQVEGRLTRIEGLAELNGGEGSGPRIEKLAAVTGATVVRLSFVAGQTMDDHKAGAPILVQAVTGDISFSTADETVSLVPGTAVHVDAGIVHRLVANADSVVQLTILR